MSGEVSFDPTKAMSSQQKNAESGLALSNPETQTDQGIEHEVIDGNNAEQVETEQVVKTVEEAREELHNIISQMDEADPRRTTLQRISMRSDSDMEKALPTLSKYFEKLSLDKKQKNGVDNNSSKQANINLDEEKVDKDTSETLEVPEENILDEGIDQERINIIKQVISERLGILQEEIDPDFIEAISRGLAFVDSSLKEPGKDGSRELLMGELQGLEENIVKDYLRKKTYNDARKKGLSDEEANIASQISVMKFNNESRSTDGNSQSNMDHFRAYISDILGQRLRMEISRIKLTPDVIMLIIAELSGGNAQ
jgi:hypothetical protein